MELEETLHDSIPRYLIDLVPTWSKSPTETVSQTGSLIPLECRTWKTCLQTRNKQRKKSAFRVKMTERPSSSDSESRSCSYSSSSSSSDSEKDDQEDEPANGGEINEEAYNEPDPSLPATA